MSRIDALVSNYRRQVSLPWESGLAGKQRVWFLVYDNREERAIRARLAELEQVTLEARHRWLPVDVTRSLTRWLAGQDYLDEYFANPEEILALAPEIREAVVGEIRSKVAEKEADDQTVVALVGGASLFGFVRLSSVIDSIAPDIPGRLLVLFPGELQKNNYHLLGAGDGWNYLAVPITCHAGDLT